jgi:trehalose 6-phosphate phosphatase
MPELATLSGIQGVDLEDKKWSVAVHVRRVSHDDRIRVSDFLGALSRTTGIRLLRGPEVHEIQLLPEIDKLFGVVILCEMLNFVPGPGTLVYAGDDENDALVMRWVLRKGGTALSVGRDPMIPGVAVLEHPAALVTEVRRLAGLNAGRQEVPR